MVSNSSNIIKRPVSKNLYRFIRTIIFDRFKTIKNYFKKFLPEITEKEITSRRAVRTGNRANTAIGYLCEMF